MPRLSYWERQSFFTKIDVLIIGSGIVGISTAIHLKESDPKLHIVIIERGTLPIGASTRNAGFACFGSMTELIDDLSKHSESEVFGTVEKRWKGLKALRTKLSDQQLDYKEWGGHEVFTNTDQESYEQCLKHLPDFNKALKDIIGTTTVYKNNDNNINTFGFKNTEHLIVNTQEGQINTGKMMKGLLALAREVGVEIYNGIEITNWESHSNGVIVQTKEGWTLDTSTLVVATNAFTTKLFPPIQVTPARNQVMITKPIPNLKLKGCFHYDKGYVYFRNIDGRVLLGGARNVDLENENTDEFGDNEKIESVLTKLLEEVILPNQPFEIDQRWSGILGVGESKSPIIEKVEPNIYAAVRLGGMGVAIGYGVGADAAKLVLSN